MRVIIAAAIGIGGFYLIQHFHLHGFPLQVIAASMGGLFVYQVMDK